MMGPDASLTPELIQAQSFTTAFRGYDSTEVKAFLTRVATEMRAWKERAEGLESAWHSAEERAARPPVLDEDTLMAAVGEETAAILRTARAAAADMRAKAAEEAERALSEARAEAEQALTEARAEAERARSEAQTEVERALTEARAQAERMVQEAESALTQATAAAEEQAAALLAAARQEATEVTERATGEADNIRAHAEKERQLTIEGANNTRDRILEDLTRRRRVATVQIEQLRAGRERLIESYAVVRRTLEEVQSELSRADAEARAAADEVGRRLRDEPDVELSQSSREMTEPIRPTEEPPSGASPASEPPVSEVPAEQPAAKPAGGDGGTEVQDRAGEEPAQARSSEEPADGTAVEGTAAQETAGEAAAGEAPAGEPASAGAEASPASGAAPSQPGAEPAVGSAVDELFARIRATRAAVGAEHITAPAEQGTAPAEQGTAPAEPPTPAAGQAASAHPPAHPPALEAMPDQPTGEETAVDTEARPADDAQPEPEASSSGPAPTEAAASSRRGSKKRSGPQSTSNGRHPSPSGPAPTSAAPAPTVRARSTVRVIEPEKGPEDRPVAESETHAGEGEHAAEDAVPDGDESLMQAREFAVVDLEVNLTRRLKRALQDEQNDVLDRLRNLKGTPTADRLLPDETAQIARYAGAARPLLSEAASAGAVFTDETLGLPGRDAPVEVEVADLAEECGSGIVSPLRRRLEQAIQIGGGDDQAVLVESLGAAYREWKTQRIERLAGDVLSAAFSRGTWQAAPGSARFRWIVEDTDGPCPDCDDDALAGELPKGEAFPTGQHHPPAHSGCRCLLVPSLPGD